MNLSNEEKKDIVKNCKEAKKKGIEAKMFCDAVGVPERSFHHWKASDNKDKTKIDKRGRKTSPKNKLSRDERKEVVNLLLKKEWADLSPIEIYYKHLDEEGKIIASPSTFYRIARQENLLTKRTKTSVKSPLNRDTPHLMTTGPNQVWSWDVSQIRSDIRYQRFYLYVIIDIWSRFVVGWILENHEKTEYAINMWKDALEQQYINGKDLINHSDNGSIMTSGEMLKFIEDVEMVDSYSRSGVSDDNPFSESLFGTIKTFRSFPRKFSDIKKGREYFEKYFNEYNYTYKHSGIQFITPAERHYGEEAKVLKLRNKIIMDFYENNSHRYSKQPKQFKPIKEVRVS